MKALGAVGVGQSSWGPTLFAAMPDEASARESAGRLLGDWLAPPLDLRIAAASPAGAGGFSPGKLANKIADFGFSRKIHRQKALRLLGTRAFAFPQIIPAV